MNDGSISRIWKMMRMQFKTFGKSFFSYPLLCAMGVCLLSWLFNMNEPWPVLMKDVFHFTFMISVVVPFLVSISVSGVFGQLQLTLPASNPEKYIALLLNGLAYTVLVLLCTLSIAVPVMMLSGWIGYRETFTLGQEVWSSVISGFELAYCSLLCCGFFGLGLALHRSSRYKFAYISSFFLAMFLPSFVQMVTGIGKPVLEPYATVYFPILGVAFLICSYRNFRRLQLKTTEMEGINIDL